jgi:hypothetical protein
MNVRDAGQNKLKGLDLGPRFLVSWPPSATASDRNGLGRAPRTGVVSFSSNMSHEAFLLLFDEPSSFVNIELHQTFVAHS